MLLYVVVVALVGVALFLVAGVDLRPVRVDLAAPARAHHRHRPARRRYHRRRRRGPAIPAGDPGIQDQRGRLGAGARARGRDRIPACAVARVGCGGTCGAGGRRGASARGLRTGFGHRPMSAEDDTPGVEPFRCPWSDSSSLYREYHDVEWVNTHPGSGCHVRAYVVWRLSSPGVVVDNGFTQAARVPGGAFANFAVDAVALFDDDRCRPVDERCRHRPESREDTGIASTMRGKSAKLDVDLDALLWSFAPPPRPRPVAISDVPATFSGVDRDGEGTETARDSHSSDQRPHMP